MDDKPKTLREAIEKILWCCQWMYDNTGDQATKDHLKKPIEIAEAALSLPVRNCDVGTASEQTERFDGFCRKHLDRNIGEEEFRHPCDRCPIAKARIKEGCGSSQKGCVFIWEQMPYDEGADNEQG